MSEICSNKPEIYCALYYAVKLIASLYGVKYFGKDSSEFSAALTKMFQFRSTFENTKECQIIIAYTLVECASLFDQNFDEIKCRESLFHYINSDGFNYLIEKVNLLSEPHVLSLSGNTVRNLSFLLRCCNNQVINESQDVKSNETITVSTFKQSTEINANFYSKITSLSQLIINYCKIERVAKQLVNNSPLYKGVANVFGNSARICYEAGLFETSISCLFWCITCLHMCCTIEKSGPEDALYKSICKRFDQAFYYCLQTSKTKDHVEFLSMQAEFFLKRGMGQSESDKERNIQHLLEMWLIIKRADLKSTKPLYTSLTFVDAVLKKLVNYSQLDHLLVYIQQEFYIYHKST